PGLLWLGRQDRPIYQPMAMLLAVFISYHSPDIAAASTLRQELNQIGGDVSSVDKNDLKPGDKWEQVNRNAIQRLSLFLPLLSANTEKQTDAYFHVEWSEAVARLPSIVGRKFICPIVIDEKYTRADSYTLVPDEFKKNQYGHAPQGHMSDALKKEI